MTAHEPPVDSGPAIDPPKTESMLTRRDFVRNTVRLAVAGAIVPGTLAQVLPALAPAAIGGGGAGPVIVRDEATNAKIPVTLDMLAGDPPVVVTAEWNFLPAVVYKVRRSILEASSNPPDHPDRPGRGYNTAQHAIQHPTEQEHAILVYDGKCKHLGCTIGFNAGLGASVTIPDYNVDGRPDGRVLCPCHQGQYDIYDLAVNIPGTPPPAPLNVIRFNIGTAEMEDGSSAANAILGVEKLLQDSYRQADLAGDGSAFSLRPADQQIEGGA